MQKCKLFVVGLACVFAGNVCFAEDNAATETTGDVEKKEEKKVDKSETENKKDDKGFFQDLFGGNKEEQKADENTTKQSDTKAEDTDKVKDEKKTEENKQETEKKDKE